MLITFHNKAAAIFFPYILFVLQSYVLCEKNKSAFIRKNMYEQYGSKYCKILLQN